MKSKVAIQVYWKDNPDMGVDVMPVTGPDEPLGGVFRHYPAENKRQLDAIIEGVNLSFEVVGVVYD
jgi:hypothetical protein